LAESLDLYKLKHAKGHSITILYGWYLLKDIPRWTKVVSQSIKSF
jgi:hypothetical protein